MELRQLEYFVTVSEEASFTRAAAKLHVAQPGVSAQIRRLERELGQDLLDRTGRTVRLTDVGAAVLPYARAALEATRGARLAVGEITGLVRGHVAVGMVASISAFDLPGLLAGFHHDHPAVEISLSEAGSGQLTEALQARKLDVAFAGVGSAPPQGIATRIVADEAVVAATSRGDELAAGTSIGLEALRTRALVILPRGTGLRSRVDAACAAAGFRPRVAFEASDPHMLAQLASRGLGVAILPESAANVHAADLHVLSITGPRMRGRIALAWRAAGPMSAAARAFIGHATAVLAKGRQDS
ncbi:MAG: LysR family transcriptional regulator [Micromonosporaceae bacterium]